MSGVNVLMLMEVSVISLLAPYLVSRVVSSPQLQGGDMAESLLIFRLQ